MAENISECIMSEDYADYIAEYSTGLQEVESRFSPDCINVINFNYAIVYKRIRNVERISVSNYGYAAFPKCFGLLDSSSIESINAGRLRRQPNLALRGKDVIIGVIDTGIDYNNKAFQNADSTSRIVALWDQTAEYSEEETYNVRYGRVYSTENINEAIAAQDPYTVVPQRDDLGHGTFMTAIAAGSEDRANDFIGVAPDARIAVVKLKQAKKYLRDYYFIKENIPCFQENDIMLGIRFLTEVANKEQKPLVIYIGLGTNSGDHNGSLYVEEYLDYVANRSGVAAVIAGGNEVNYGHHFKGNISQCYQNILNEQMGRNEETNRSFNFDTVEVNVGSNELGFALEIWSDNPVDITIGLQSPTGEYIGNIASRAGTSNRFDFLFDNSSVFVDYLPIEKLTGDELVFIRFQNPSQGIWKIFVNYDIQIEGRYDMWLPMREFVSNETSFLNSDPNTTICSPGNTRYAITVSGYNHNTSSIYINSSRGFTRANTIKPDIAAPSVDIFGPDLAGNYTRKTGTSIGAAHTAGAVALLFEWAITDGNLRLIDSLQVKKYLIRGAQRSNDLVYPNKEWGWGTLDIYNTFVSLSRTI